MAMVEQATGPSLSPAVVAAGLGGVQSCGGHCANHSCQCIAANGPVLVNENKPLNMCVCTEQRVFFIGVLSMGDFNTILHAQLEFSFHGIFNNTFRQGFAAGELILPIIPAIGGPFIFQVLGLAIVNVMGFGNPV